MPGLSTELFQVFRGGKLQIRYNGFTFLLSNIQVGINARNQIVAIFDRNVVATIPNPEEVKLTEDLRDLSDALSYGQTLRSLEGYESSIFGLSSPFTIQWAETGECWSFFRLEEQVPQD